MIELPRLPRGAVVTVGSFDGLHRGHRAVLEAVTDRARRHDRASVLVTFEPHPGAVLHPEAAPERLTAPAERAELLAATPLDYLVVLRFDRSLAAMAPEEFLERVLVQRCQLAELVIGQDHGFGRGRGADATTLPALGRSLGFSVEVVPPVADADGTPISSTGIRQAVRAGDFGRAARWLGEPYRVSGTVVEGARRGRTIGVPTINVAPPAGKLLPPDGVYAVRVEWGGGTALGMMNQGNRPTVGDPTRWLETHLFDFDGDLYGRRVRIEWVEKLREIRRFSGLSELQTQLAQDRAQARAVFAERFQTSTV